MISTGNRFATLVPGPPRAALFPPPTSMTDARRADGNAAVIKRGREIDTEVAIQLNNAAIFKPHFQWTRCQSI